MSAVAEVAFTKTPLPSTTAQATPPQGRAGDRAPVAGSMSVPATSVVLPLRFMITGLLALCIGVALLAVRPDMLATYHYNQYIIAVTHLFVLGWLCTIVMGAMYQLVPVALETRLYSERLARWQFLCHSIGFAGMVWMFWISNLKQVGHFGCLLGVGVCLFVYNIARTLARVPRWNWIATAVAAALGWLSIAILAGLTIAAGKCSYDSADTLPLNSVTGALVHGLKSVASWSTRFDQLGAMHAHAHLGTVGVFLLLIVGISYKLVPMFTLSEVQSWRRAGLSVVLLNVGLLGAFVTILLRSPWKMAFAVVLVVGLLLYGLELRAILAARKRRALDWGLKYFLTALGLLAPVSVLGLVLAYPRLPFTVFTGQLENLYGFLGVVGVFSLAVIGMLYKIIPFLVWYRTYSTRIGKGRVPSLADLYSAGWQKAGYWSYLAGLLVASAGIILRIYPVVSWGCAMLLGSLLTLAINVTKMLAHLLRPQVAHSSHQSTLLSQPANKNLLRL